MFIQFCLIARLYLGHYDPSGGKPPEQIFFMQTQGLHNIMTIYKPTLKLAWRTKQSISQCTMAADQSILTSLLQGALRPKIIIVFTQQSL